MTWDEFCDELAKDIELARKWISYEVYTGKDGFGIVRFDLFKGKPFHFIVGIKNDKDTCNEKKAYSLANALRFFVEEALETKQPPKMRGFNF